MNIALDIYDIDQSLVKGCHYHTLVKAIEAHRSEHDGVVFDEIEVKTPEWKDVFSYSDAFAAILWGIREKVIVGNEDELYAIARRIRGLAEKIELFIPED